MESNNYFFNKPIKINILNIDIPSPSEIQSIILKI